MIPKDHPRYHSLVRRENIANIEAKFNENEFLTALDMVKASKEKATSINSELTEVIAKYKSNVKGRK